MRSKDTIPPSGALLLIMSLIPFFRYETKNFHDIKAIVKEKRFFYYWSHSLYIGIIAVYSPRVVIRAYKDFLPYE